MAKSFVARSIDILRSPSAEWQVVAGEQDAFLPVLLRFALPWIVITSLIGGLIAPMLMDQQALQMAGLADLGMGTRLAMALFGAVWAFATFAVQALLTQVLSNSFGGNGDSGRAAQLAAYASTAHWAASLLAFIPIVGGLIGLLGLVFSIYLYAVGATPVAGVPDDRKTGFVIVSVIVWAVIAAIAGLINVFVLMPALFGIDMIGNVMDAVQQGMATPR